MTEGSEAASGAGRTPPTTPGSASMPEWLLALLVCPVDRAQVRSEGDVLVCTVCNRRYPVRDGIPVMIPDRKGEHTF